MSQGEPIHQIPFAQFAGLLGANPLGAAVGGNLGMMAGSLPANVGKNYMCGLEERERGMCEEALRPIGFRDRMRRKTWIGHRWVSDSEYWLADKYGRAALHVAGYPEKLLTNDSRHAANACKADMKGVRVIGNILAQQDYKPPSLWQRFNTWMSRPSKKPFFRPLCKGRSPEEMFITHA